jgi:hypothetical protein
VAGLDLVTGSAAPGCGSPLGLVSPHKATKQLDSALSGFVSPHKAKNVGSAGA